MRVFILGWGSLIWEPRNLPREGPWHEGGPKLPIEFSRVSRDCRLTLVVDQAAGEEVTTRYAVSPRAILDDTVDDLKQREGTTREYIGFVDVKHGQFSRQKFPAQQDVSEIVQRWCQQQGFDAAVWTALPPNFRDQTGKDFCVENAVCYLNGLPKEARNVALHYIQSAPREIMTPLRRRLLDDGAVEL